MAALAQEQAKSRKWSEQSGNISYIVTGTEDPAAAIAAVLTDAPSTFNGHLVGSPEITRVIERQSDDIMFIDVPYTPPELASDDPVNGSIEFAFDFGISNEKIKRSISTVNSYGSDAPDFGGLINVSGSGAERKVEGVDVGFPTGSFTIVFRAPSTIVTDTYRRTVEALVGTVNSTTFQGRAAGEVRFDGASGRQVFGKSFDFEISFRFSRRANETGISVGSITGIAKKGWEFLWVYYGREDDSTNKATIASPRNVYIEQVYRTADFSALGLP